MRNLCVLAACSAPARRSTRAPYPRRSICRAGHEAPCRACTDGRLRRLVDMAAQRDLRLSGYYGCRPRERPPSQVVTCLTARRKPGGALAIDRQIHIPSVLTADRGTRGTYEGVRELAAGGRPSQSRRRWPGREGVRRPWVASPNTVVNFVLKHYSVGVLVTIGTYQ
jgi:hypothetical protein